LRTEAGTIGRQRGALGSVELALVIPVYLVVWIMLIQAVRWGYVGLDSLVAARNAAWQKELYYPQDDDAKSAVNFYELIKIGVMDGDSDFLEGRVGNVHEKNVLAFVNQVEIEAQGLIVESFRRRLQNAHKERPKEGIPKGLRGDMDRITRILDDYPFPEVRGTAVYPKVELLGIYAGEREPAPSVLLELIRGNWREAALDLVGVRHRAVHHYTDFALGWNLRTQEQFTRPYVKSGRVFETGYDSALIKRVYSNPVLPPQPRLFTESTFPRYRQHYPISN
jgi:hypothetical protein